jgi:hypothetical protein
VPRVHIKISRNFYQNIFISTRKGEQVRMGIGVDSGDLKVCEERRWKG